MLTAKFSRMDAAGVLPEFTGVAVHDAWAPYHTYRALTHALGKPISRESSRPSPTPSRTTGGAGRSRVPTRCAR